jgi:hypothetical protein
MTTGVLIFAFDNEHVDYLAMANWSARNIRRHLDLPVAVVTDCTIPDHYQFEHVVPAKKPAGGQTRTFQDLPGSVTWFNGNRVDAYTLSPWSRTLVLDADYVVASDQLKTILNVDQDFLAHQTAYDVTGRPDFVEHSTFGQYCMPMWWATVMMFRRGDQARLIFESMQMIRDHWNHYKSLFHTSRSNYRNDFALSIALGIVNGHTLDHAGIPWNLATVTHDQLLTQTDQDRYRVDFTTHDNQKKWIYLTQDFHAMGKGQLGAIIDNYS